jgi:protein-tyrosine phosphatase
MIDFHNHVIPGVDDGAADLDQAREALAVMRAQGIRGVVATPHVKGSLTEDAAGLAAFLDEVDRAFAGLKEMALAEFPDVHLERGHEVMLDTPHARLDDARLRLAGTPFVLVEFPFMMVPPNAPQAVFELKMQGFSPIIAHPERYGNVDASLAQPAEWRRVGGLLQVNAGSLLGRYGRGPRETAWGLLRHGMVDYLSSDFHARGSCWTAEARAALEQEGAGEQARILTETNPARMLNGEPPLPVPPLARPRSLWRRLLGR